MDSENLNCRRNFFTESASLLYLEKDSNHLSLRSVFLEKIKETKSAIKHQWTSCYHLKKYSLVNVNQFGAGFC